MAFQYQFRLSEQKRCQSGVTPLPASRIRSPSGSHFNNPLKIRHHCFNRREMWPKPSTLPRDQNRHGAPLLTSGLPHARASAYSRPKTTMNFTLIGVLRLLFHSETHPAVSCRQTYPRHGAPSKPRSPIAPPTRMSGRQQGTINLNGGPRTAADAEASNKIGEATNYCTFTAQLRKSLVIGAGEGNRTLISGLGSPHSTTEPHPRLSKGLYLIPAVGARVILPDCQSCEESGDSTARGGLVVGVQGL